MRRYLFLRLPRHGVAIRLRLGITNGNKNSLVLIIQYNIPLPRIFTLVRAFS